MLDLRRPIYKQLSSYGHLGREDLGGLVLRAGTDLARGKLGTGDGVGRLSVRLRDDVRRLLLGGPHELFDARAETGVRRAFGLTELALRVRELSAHLERLLVERRDLGARGVELLGEAGDLAVDLAAVVAAHDDGEQRTVFGHDEPSASGVEHRVRRSAGWSSSTPARGRRPSVSVHPQVRDPDDVICAGVQIPW